jgi:uncharacterized protein (TIGR02391 family)
MKKMTKITTTTPRGGRKLPACAGTAFRLRHVADSVQMTPSTIQALANVIGETSTGLTGAQIGAVLAEAGIDDPAAQPPPGTYVVSSKRERIFRALSARQQQDHSSNAVLRFVETVMQPVRFSGDEDGFNQMRSDLNACLLTVGLELATSGKLVPVRPAKTVSEARDRTHRFRGKLEARSVHPLVLAACRDVIRDENYFHTVLEAAKSLAEEIRRKSGLPGDGSELVKAAFGYKEPGFPVLAFNQLETPSQRSEHRGLTQLCYGVFGTFRNPTAHEPSDSWTIGEPEALDICSLISLLHKRLESASATNLASG